jgi:hypothetical protein
MGDFFCFIVNNVIVQHKGCAYGLTTSWICNDSMVCWTQSQKHCKEL